MSMAAPVSMRALAVALRQAGPPSISELASAIGYGEGFSDFQKLITDFLPGRAREILSLPGEERRVWAFCELFSERYFPIYEVDSYANLAAYIPIRFHGVPEDDFHNPTDWNPGFLLMAVLGETPFPEEGFRSVWMDVAAQLVPREMLERLPPRGYPHEHLHEVLDGTRFQGAVTVAEILDHSTGCPLLDYSDADFGDGPQWDREEVDGGTEMWQECRQILEPVDKLEKWLEEDLPAHFEQLLNFLERKQEVAREQLKLPI